MSNRAGRQIKKPTPAQINSPRVQHAAKQWFNILLAHINNKQVEQSNKLPRALTKYSGENINS